MLRQAVCLDPLEDREVAGPVRDVRGQIRRGRRPPLLELDCQPGQGRLRPAGRGPRPVLLLVQCRRDLLAHVREARPADAALDPAEALLEDASQL